MSTTPGDKSTSYALIQDRSLVLQAEAGTLPLIEPWLPLSCGPVHQDDDSRAMIVVSHDVEFVRALDPDRTLLMPEGQLDYFSPEMLELVELS